METKVTSVVPTDSDFVPVTDETGRTHYQKVMKQISENALSDPPPSDPDIKKMAKLWANVQKGKESEKKLGAMLVAKKKEVNNKKPASWSIWLKDHEPELGFKRRQAQYLMRRVKKSAITAHIPKALARSVNIKRASALLANLTLAYQQNDSRYKGSNLGAALDALTTVIKFLEPQAAPP